MNDQLSKIDHLAIIVDNIEKSVDYYSTKFNCEVKFKDSTWAMLKFDNINLALVTEDEHPNHFAVVDHSIVKQKNIKYHRDGIGYIYETDPNGNFIELLDQES
jgi:extradiol dioxygenase family protein|tara:strand:+ start:1526 stop:1834 length:309 start_codon:yes stop_codon:yes gene_type:complete